MNAPSTSPSKNKLIIGIVGAIVALALAAGAFYLFRGGSIDPANPSSGTSGTHDANGSSSGTHADSGTDGTEASSGDGTASNPGAPLMSEVSDVVVFTPFGDSEQQIMDALQGAFDQQSLKMTRFDARGDLGAMNQAMQEAVKLKPKAMVIVLSNQEDVPQGLEAARKAGIPVFGIESGLTEGSLATNELAMNVVVDNGAMGKLSAQRLIDAMGGKGKVAMLVNTKHPAIKARVDAAQAAFAKAGIAVAVSQAVEGDKVAGDVKPFVGRWLAGDVPGVTGIWAGWSQAALGAAETLRDAGPKVASLPIVGLDPLPTDAQGKTRLDLPLCATVVPDWGGMATQIAGVVHNKLEHGKDPGVAELAVGGKVVNVTCK